MVHPGVSMNTIATTGHFYLRDLATGPSGQHLTALSDSVTLSCDDSTYSMLPITNQPAYPNQMGMANPPNPALPQSGFHGWYYGATTGGMGIGGGAGATDFGVSSVGVEGFGNGYTGMASFVHGGVEDTGIMDSGDGDVGMAGFSHGITGFGNGDVGVAGFNSGCDAEFSSVPGPSGLQTATPSYNYDLGFVLPQH